MARGDVTEIIINRPGEIWIEHAGRNGLCSEKAAFVSDAFVEQLAYQVARASRQGINGEEPILGATLPDGSRVQIIGPSATRGHWALAIRRHHDRRINLSEFATGPLLPATRPRLDAEMARKDPLAFLISAVSNRATILVSGRTSSGKTSFLNALLEHVPSNERLILVEDTPELRVMQENVVGLVAVKGILGEAKIDANDLLQASLRMRPDRIVLGEMRGIEAVSFLRAINTGHRGSFSTIHANTPRGALDQLALMVMQAGIGMSMAEIMQYASGLIDVIVQLDLVAGKRKIVDILILQSDKL
ncbi:P-type DNA transfer ATPase VirB11 [Novosphingobium sp. ERN07]|uniref:P-type DNA transfer ATPase VirB11 n=1 Tax=Novosphingobium sp. ERN07 TaxID=2726187 RepID=UPI00145728DA|nr:P-type DNA transfer ATPase VirB11 [Novosphingobium sp. ERN07]NLR73387.1 P-type DNA transfer ATPase VirB11 [Novosphingobium sp. ERN07]